MMDGFIEPFFKSMYEQLFSCWIQNTPIQPFVKMFGLDDLFIQNFEYGSVY